MGVREILQLSSTSFPYQYWVQDFVTYSFHYSLPILSTKDLKHNCQYSGLESWKKLWIQLVLTFNSPIGPIYAPKSTLF